ncbi:hypothetical protein Ga0074812_11542 [Parafrankia irregularis]|uniref:Uncharacterized protein n=1 Tax=Parafrankia irregularis TaxID=795642 RepID=A0A0S4QQF1_9ACTN|nr:MULTISPECIES: hypothetical protein [Parafrankia]MBE3202656.1 hypothetical protein [Parafrankia sp. CH37]CUU57840.1 hypothetical protein Ga0074812_11542 [Parafrankia irregularis]
MSTWAEQRRADRTAERNADRADRVAERDQDRKDAAEAARLKEKQTAARAAAKTQAREKRAKWRREHAVELLIYPLAVVSAVMAVPAMALFGLDLYDNPSGLVLPLLSELGVWAFAIALEVSRRRHPERSTVKLTAGVAVFGVMAFGMNFAHGLERSLLAGLMMGSVSIAGVLAHQFTVGAPPRSRAERARARIERTAERRVAKARRLAARQAVVELAADGTARLVYVPGLYLPKGRKLEAATVSGLPVPVDEWDAALADLLAGDLDPHVSGASDHDLDPIPGADLGGSGGVAVADPPPPVDPTPPKQATRTRTAKQVRAAALRLARKNGKPVSAEFLRRELRIAPAVARTLRNDVNAELYPNS